MAVTIIEFLEARIAKDEAVSKDAGRGQFAVWSFLDDGSGDCEFSIAPDVVTGNIGFGGVGTRDEGVHIARFDPARMLAECKAKRAVLAIHRLFSADEIATDNQCVNCSDYYGRYPEYSCDTVKAMAVVYADHPDYDGAWSVQG